MSIDADELLAEIGAVVVAMDERLVGVESAVVYALGGEPGRPRRRRRPLTPGTQRSAALRRARRRRGDAAGITWTVWNLDVLTPAQRKEAFGMVRGFVHWVNREYQLPLSTLAIVPCWYHHPGVVRELWALLASYRFAYTTGFAEDASAPTHDPLLWHERSLWPCLRRLRDEHGLRECVAAQRHTPQSVGDVTTDEGFEDALGTLARQWMCGHAGG